jgi:hypothetical protein
MFAAIMEIFALIAHLLTTVVPVVALPGGVRAVIAESSFYQCNALGRF